MCQPVRYVYPHCGHPIDLDLGSWTLERCPFARCYNRDCWIPNDIPDDLIKEKPWPYHNLTDPCYMPHQPRDGFTESSSLDASSVARVQGSSVTSCSDEMTSVPTTPEPEELEKVEMDRIIRKILFAEGLPAECSGFIKGEDEFHLQEDDFVLEDNQLMLDEEELRKYEATLAQATPHSDDQMTYFNEIIAQTADELSFAGVEDNIEWEKVQAVAAPLEWGDFGEDMDIDWCFDEWV